MKNLLQKYDFSFKERREEKFSINNPEHKKQTLFMLNDNPTRLKVMNELTYLNKIICDAKKKNKNVLVMCLWAGHGMIIQNS